MQEYKVEIDDVGSERWYNKDNQLHRDDDKPAVVHPNGIQYWYRNGMLHRDGGPATSFPDGSESWFKDGILHRENGPALTFANGTKEYWLNGVRQPNPNVTKELTLAEIERILGYKVKLVS
jgi:hypothetical protein